MPRKRNPPLLMHCAESVFCKEVYKFLSICSSDVNFQVFRHYVQTNLPGMYKDKIMDKLFTLYPYLSEKILELFISKNTKRVKLFYQQNDHVLKLLQKYSPRLIHLEYYGLFLGNKNLDDLNSIISNLNNLEILKAGNFENLEILKMVFNSCPKLTNFSIKSFRINIDIVEKWPSHESLKELDLGNEKLSSKLISLIFSKFPNLENFGQCSCGLAIKNCPNYPLKLLKIVDSGTEISTMKAILNKCPNLVSLKLNQPQSGAIPLLTHLNLITHLSLDNFNSEDLYYLLIECGHKFESLTFRNANQKINLTLIIEYCSNLKILKVLTQKVCVENRVVYHNKLKKFINLFPMDNFEILLQGLTRIENLDITLGCPFDTDVIIKLFPAWHFLKSLSIDWANQSRIFDLWKLIINCPNLEKLKITHYCYIPDDVIRLIRQRNEEYKFDLNFSVQAIINI